MAEHDDALQDAIDQLEEAADALEAALEAYPDAEVRAKFAENLPKLQAVIDGLNQHYQLTRA
jgi:hypothetical protein